MTYHPLVTKLLLLRSDARLARLQRSGLLFAAGLVTVTVAALALRFA
jgi:hypothetical protein